MTVIASTAVIASFADELTTVVGALIGKSATVRPIDAGPTETYLATIEAVRNGRGSLEVHFERSGVQALSRRLHDIAEQDDDAWLKSLKDVCAQAVTSLEDRNAETGARLTVASVESTDQPVPRLATLLEIVVEGEDFTLRLALSGSLELGEAAGQPARAPAGGSHPGLEMILDIDLPLVVRLGRTEMSLKSLTTLGPGSLIDFGRSPDDPVDVIVSNQVVARGDVVVVGGHYGVRIRDVVSAAERVRKMEVEFQ